MTSRRTAGQYRGAMKAAFGLARFHSGMTASSAVQAA
jgi:hypothetical protein